MEVATQRRVRTPYDTPCAVALGFFDGVHLGHAAVIGAMARYAAQNGLRSAVFTFTRHSPSPGKGEAVYTGAQKHAAFEALGVQTCYQPPFEAFCALSPEAFVSQMLLSEYNAKALFCGQDFTFGQSRAGNADRLQALCAQSGVHVEVLPIAFYQGKPVSSSRIRQALAAGHMADVNAMLGRPYDLTAPVAHGKALGGKLGFPTINQSFAPGLQTPAYGIYITRTTANGRQCKLNGINIIADINPRSAHPHLRNLYPRLYGRFVWPGCARGVF